MHLIAIKMNKNIYEKVVGQYPTTVDTFAKVQEENFAVFCQKQHDYGSRNISLGGDMDRDDDKKLALIGITIRLNDKVQRLLNLIKDNDDPANESIRDAFLDISNYGAIAQVVMDGKWSK
jgi:hypothetical protein